MYSKKILHVFSFLIVSVVICNCNVKRKRQDALAVLSEDRVVQSECRRRTSSYGFLRRMHYSLRDEVLFDGWGLDGFELEEGWKGKWDGSGRGERERWNC
jgi:hypothetical protein